MLQSSILLPMEGSSVVNAQRLMRTRPRQSAILMRLISEVQILGSFASTVTKSSRGLAISEST